MSSIARVFRALSVGAEQLGSSMRIAWLRLCYPGLRIGRGVLVGTGTRVRVRNGAVLEIGARTVVEPRCLLVSEGLLRIGADGFIGAGSTISATCDIQIGSDALIAANVTIRDQDHGRDPAIPYRLQRLVAAPVTIGTNVWLGVNAVVLKGVTIGDHAVVAAAAVVTRDVPVSAVAVGVPARIVRTP